MKLVAIGRKPFKYGLCKREVEGIYIHDYTFRA